MAMHGWTVRCTMTETNLHTVLTGYVAAIQQRDLEAAMNLIADNVVTHVPGRSPSAGDLNGRAAFLGYIQAVDAMAHGNVTTEILDALIGQHNFALLVRERIVTYDHTTLDIRRCNVYRVQCGEIVEIWIFESDQYGVDAFLGVNGGSQA